MINIFIQQPPNQTQSTLDGCLPTIIYNYQQLTCRNTAPPDN